MKWSDVILNNFWPKVISLALAVATWFYVFDLVNTDPYTHRRDSLTDIYSRMDMSMKELPVKPLFSGISPEGYRVDFDRVKIVPDTVTVYAPSEILSDVAELTTNAIDIGEYTRSSHLRVDLDPDIKDLEMKGKKVDIYIPVESLPSADE